MTMLDEAKPNGHAEPATRPWDARLVAIERRLAALPAEIAKTGERRVVILRDALADFAAGELRERDEKIAVLKGEIAELKQRLEQKMAVDQQVAEIATRLEERQARRDRGTDGDIIQTMDKVIAQERQSACKEFKAADAEMQRALEAKLAAVEERLKAVPGKLPVSKIWRQASVIYEGEVVSYDGSLWQACKDTAQAPGGPDWVCVARAGRDGCDGRTPNVCGAYDAYEKYQRLDVVVYECASYIARRDDPGLCPGDGWQLLASRGKAGDKGQPGPPGKKGERGERGEATPTIVSWQIDRAHYRAVPTMSDGRAGATLDLRELFEQFQVETS